MSAIPTAAIETPRRPSSSAKRARWFFALCGVVVVAGTLVGFEQFYFHGRAFPGREITPPIRTLIIAHGVAMALWITLFIVQPMLVATKRLKVHMALGRAGAVVAAVVLVLGVILAFRSSQVAPPEARIMGFKPDPFLAIPLNSILLFGILVGVGIWQRKRPAIHRAAMLTATLGALTAALNRIDALNHLFMGTLADRVLGPFVPTVALGVVLLVVRCAWIRGFDKWLAAGVAVLALFAVGDTALAHSAAWESFATRLLH